MVQLPQKMQMQMQMQMQIQVQRMGGTTLNFMTTAPVDAAMLEITLDGFRQAVQRVARAPASVPQAMYVVLTECVWWAICVDEAMAQKFPNYKSARNTDERGKVVCGLNYARSALGHNQLFAVGTGGGLTVPFEVPFHIETYAVWFPLDALPEFRNLKWALYYELHIAGRKVLDTLADTDAWFLAAEEAYNAGSLS